MSTKLIRYVWLLCLIYSPFLLSAEHRNAATKREQKSFIRNNGQVRDQSGGLQNDIDFVLHGKGMSLFIGNGKLSYQFYHKAGNRSFFGKQAQSRAVEPSTASALALYRMDVRLIGANQQARATIEPATGFEYYYLHGLPTEGISAGKASRIVYHDVYLGIDWVFYFNGKGELEHDFVLHPGAKVSDIQIRYEGATQLGMDADGNLQAVTPMGKVTERAPIAYEQVGGKRVPVSFQLSNNVLSFHTGSYNGGLVIDPSVVWGTYFGGEDNDYVSGIVTGKDGMVYITGGTSSIGNIATNGAFQQIYGGGFAYMGNDAFLAKFSPQGQCLWSTYYGGADEDVALAITKDTSGNLYIAGITLSDDAIATTGSHQPLRAGGYDAFVARFDTSGRRIWGTYIGGAGDEGERYQMGLTCDRFNQLYICGATNSNTGIATAGTHQQVRFNRDAFLIKMNAAGDLIWGTYFGGNIGEYASGLATDSIGNVYMVGTTNSPDNIAYNAQVQPALAGDYDNYIARFNSSGRLDWSTYLGGTASEYGGAIGIRDSIIFLGGSTASNDFSPLSGVFAGGNMDAFITAIDTGGRFLWGNYIGGPGYDEGESIAVSEESVYLSGSAVSNSGIATTGAINETNAGSSDLFIVKYSATGTKLWGSYFGGQDYDAGARIAVDRQSNLYLGGYTSSATGIVTTGSHQEELGGGDMDGLLIRINDCERPAALGAIAGNSPVCSSAIETYSVGAVTNITGYYWVLPTGWTGASTTNTIQATASATGGAIKVAAYNSCATGDTSTLNVSVYPVPAIPSIQFSSGMLSTTAVATAYQWNLNGNPISGATSQTYSPVGNGDYSLTITDHNGCKATSAIIAIRGGMHLDTPENFSLLLYPNPATDFLKLRAKRPTNITILSADGRTVVQRKVESGDNTLDISSLANGIYYVRAGNQNWHFSKIAR